MRTAAEWLDLARERAALPSDYAIAKHLGVTTQAVSKLRAGTIGLTEETATALAELADADPVTVYAEVKAARAKRTEQRAFWARVARGLAAGIILVISVGYGAPEVRAAGLWGGISACAGYTFYALARLWRRVRKRVRIVTFPTPRDGAARHLRPA